MRRQSNFSPVRWFSSFFLIAALVLVAVQLVRFSRLHSNLPPGLLVAGVPVGGLDRQHAGQRLMEVYSTPVELRYNNAVIHLDPSVVDFQLDLESMLAAADITRTQQNFWLSYWDFLWNRTSTPAEIPLSATYSETRLRNYLQEEISKRYDQPPLPAQPIAGTVNFKTGQQGMELDVNGSVLLIENALRSLSSRTVILPLQRTNPGRPAFQNLEVLLKQTIDVAGFDGLASIYMLDLQTAQEMHFAYQNKQEVSVSPIDIAFTASSIIKIPIMVAVFRRLNDNPDAETLKLLSDMIDKSGNEAADWLMDRVIATNRSPLEVATDMKALGLNNTFLAGYFAVGSPLLEVVKTPANQRADINTDPDPYSQTTPTEIGMLLEDIYQCANNGGGALVAAFSGQITQAKCQTMIDYLVKNKIGVLLEAGLPDGTRLAHKHGWVSTNGIINTVGDAGIVYTPGGNYILVIFLHHPQQLVWDPASKLIAELSKAVYNYYNLPQP